jgi:hypothetical protein
MIDFGTVRPGTTLYIPFATYDSNDPTASVTMTGFAVGDILIYKDGSVTQRASTAGFTLLDTDGTDFDAITGLHGFSINLADNTTAGFYASGSQYWVVVSSVTVDAGVINFIAATFRIGQHNAIHNTTIATLASQTSFTLTTGPAEDNALNGCVIYFHDVASAVQCGFGVVTAYTGATRTVTLAAGPSYTIAASDNVSVFFPANTQFFGSTPVTARDIGASVLLSSGTGTGQVSLTSGAVTAGTVSDKTGYSLAATTGLGNQTANITGNLSGSVGSVTAAVTAGTVSDKTGYSLTATTGLGNQTANITGNLSGSVGSVTGAVTGAVGSVTGNVGGNVTGSVGSVATGGIVSTSFAAGAINAAAIAADAIGASELATDAVTEIANAVLAAGSIDGYSLENALRLCLAALGGKVSGAGTTTITFRNASDTANRIVATVDADGNRSAVTLTTA